MAYKNLLSSKWVWKPGKCPCGGTFSRVSWKTSMQRGHGRLFVRCQDCEGYKDVMSFSALPCLRWPIVHYWSFLQHWFAASHRPSSEEIARRMKVSGQANSAARKLGRVLLSAEALCAQRTQQKRTLSGLLEVDGIRASESLCFLGRQRCGTCSTLVRCSVAHARSTCTA
ncbi:unnamed protein product [Cladocopium goreaui]|uniref:Transposase zinc-ribbon domain-containing protein n=1 Tax=Cladocopium goreaui TaxID=2562237 RepID=A0A9P1DL03_9DINO|nr:unnamed protein product [Cladocopium goreaui]